MSMRCVCVTKKGMTNKDGMGVYSINLRLRAARVSHPMEADGQPTTLSSTMMEMKAWPHHNPDQDIRISPHDSQ